jgi:hypothetical protein
MTLDEFLDFAEQQIMDPDEFVKALKDEQKVNGKDQGHSGKKGPKGLWVEQDSHDLTIKESFKHGPPCLAYIARETSADFQHNYLFNVAIFFKRKYPENWDTALGWVNYHVLRPAGNSEKLTALIKDFKNRDYEYRCKDEPICSHCLADNCRRQPFGVGQGKGGTDKLELGMTIMNRNPRIFIVNIGENRVKFGADELLKVHKYREKCMAYSESFPDVVKQSEWDGIVRRAVEEANRVEPPDILQSYVNEIELLELFFSIFVPTGVRQGGQEYLNGKIGDEVRVNVSDQAIYFKRQSLMRACRRMGLRTMEIDRLRNFIEETGTCYPRTDSRGGWYRSTYSVPMSLFDPDVIAKWLAQLPES